MPDLSAAVRAHQALVDAVKAAYPEETEESLADSILSATELDEVLIATLRVVFEREAQATALDAMVNAMVARKRRLEDGTEAMRRAVLNAMQEVGWRRLPSPPPDFSVAVSAGKQKVLITDEAALPFDLCRAVVTPDKTAIREALEEGGDVPGAVLGNRVPGLVIHRR